MEKQYPRRRHDNAGIIDHTLLRPQLPEIGDRQPDWEAYAQEYLGAGINETTNSFNDTFNQMGPSPDCQPEGEGK